MQCALKEEGEVQLLKFRVQLGKTQTFYFLLLFFLSTGEAESYER